VNNPETLYGFAKAA